MRLEREPFFGGRAKVAGFDRASSPETGARWTGPSCLGLRPGRGGRRQPPAAGRPRSSRLNRERLGSMRSSTAPPRDGLTRDADWGRWVGWVSVLGLLPLACGPEEGNGVPMMEVRTIQVPFQGIRVSDGLVVEVRLSPEDRGRAEVRSDANLVSSIETEVDDGVLEISADNIEPTVESGVEVTMDVLVSLSGADDDTVLRVSEFGLPSQDLFINLSEEAEADLSGACGRLTAIVTGSSVLRASGLSCEAAEFDILDGGRVESQVNGPVALRASGGDSRIVLTGNPNLVEQRVSDDVTVVVD